MKFTEYDKAIMIGLLLGDGYIDPRGQIQICHGNKQHEYCTYKARLLHSVTGGKEIKVHTLKKIFKYTTRKGVYKEVESINHRFKRQSKSFMYFRELLYKNGRKTITSEVLNLIAPISIALWWMDDGCLTEKYTYRNNERVKCGYTLRLYTYLTKKENELIREYFINHYNMVWNVVPADNPKDNTQWMLRCGVHEGRKFLNIIKDIVRKNVPTLSYKVIDI